MGKSNHCIIIIYYITMIPIESDQHNHDESMTYDREVTREYLPRSASLSYTFCFLFPAN